MNKKIKIILLILILILLVLIISFTYSKYTAEAGATIKRDIASWVIKVNDTDITVNPSGTASTTFNITGADVKWEENTHTAEGKVSPGMKGYFYLRIDPQNTQTALKYTIDIDIESISGEQINFRTNNISEENKKELKIKTVGKNSTLQRIKLLDEIKSDDTKIRIDTIKVEIEWVDNAADAESNDLDTKVGEVYGKKIQIPVTVNVIQYTGEGYDF